MLETRRSVALAGTIIGVCMLQVAGATAPAGAQSAAPTPLAGIITAPTGDPMPGVAVSARAEGTPITTSVFTDDAGRYYFPPLAPPLEGGRYRVWAQAVGYETASADVVLDPGRRMAHDFTLAAAADFTHQLSGVEWLDVLPAETREDRRLKEVFRVTCTECHQAGLALQNRFDERGWLAMIDLMANVSYHGWRGYDSRPSITMEYYREELATYLTRARGPESPPLTFNLQPRPTGEAARHVVTEYDIPIAELPTELTSINGSEWSEGIPSGMRGGGGMHDAAVDDDGNVWITDSVANDFRTLARIDPRTGQVTGFKLTAADGKRARNAHGITKARNGMLWFDTAGSLGRLDPTTETFELYTPPRPLRVGGSLQEDGQGNIWVGNRHGALKFDPDGQRLHVLPEQDHRRRSDLRHSRRPPRERLVGAVQHGHRRARERHDRRGERGADAAARRAGPRGPADAGRPRLLPTHRRDALFRKRLQPGRAGAAPARGRSRRRHGVGGELVGLQPGEDRHPHAGGDVLPPADRRASLRDGGRPEPYGVDEPVVRRRRRQVRSEHRGIHDLQAPQPRDRVAPHRGRQRGRAGRLGRVPGSESCGAHPAPYGSATPGRPRWQRTPCRRGRRPVAPSTEARFTTSDGSEGQDYRTSAAWVYAMDVSRLHV